MDARLRKELEAGGVVPLRRVEEIKNAAAKAHADKFFRDTLFRRACADMGRESAEAAWILTHLPNTDNNAIDEYRLQLTETAMSTMNVSLRRLTLALLERLQWNEQDIRSDFLDFCFERMLNNDETYGVRALCIKIAYAQCRHYVELREELRISLSLIEPETIGSGLKHCRNKTLQQL